MTNQIGLILEPSELPNNRKGNIWVAHEFVATGIKSLQQAELVHAKISQDSSQMIVWLGKASVGMMCLAQGMELLLCAIIQSEEIKFPKGGKPGQHQLLPRFKAICDNSSGLTENLYAIFGQDGQQDVMTEATSIVEALEDNFSSSRYFGVDQNRSKISAVNSLRAGKLVMALATTYPMLHTVSLAKSIGFKVSTSP